jgi:hypothetical protein
VIHTTHNLQRRLDAFLGGEGNPDALLQELSTLCETTPDSAWDVLSLIDQYHRRGKLSVALFRTVKHEIERQALGIQGGNGIAGIFDPAHVSAHVSVQPGATAVPDDCLAIHEPMGPTGTPHIQIGAAHGDVASARHELQRYPNRIELLPLATRRSSAVPSEVQRESNVSCADVRNHVRRRRIRSSQAVLLASVVFGLGASQALRDIPRPVDEGNMSLSAAPAPSSPPDAPGTIALSTDRYVVFPGQTTAEINVHRSGGTGGDVKFVWWTKESGAKPGKDYAFERPKIAHMLEGRDSLQLSVPILANPLRKHTEMFYVVIGNPEGGASLGSIRRAAVFIMRPD